MNWMGGSPVVLLQPPVQQGNFHWLNDGTLLVLVNNIALLPLQMTAGAIEWYPGPVALDQMNATGQRTPLALARLQVPSGPCQPGAAMLLPLPRPPNGAMYELIILSFQGVSADDPAGDPGTTDYLLVPLDAALQPQIDSASALVNPVLGGNLSLSWSAVPGRIYNIQYKSDLSSPTWMDSGAGDILAWSSEMNFTLPVAGTQGFYRVYLVPQ
jgi:hypothetical protein